MTEHLLAWGPRARRAVLLAVVFGVPVFFLKGVTHDQFNVPKLALLVAGVSLAGAIRLAEVLLGARPSRLRLLAVPAAAFLVPLVVSWLASPYRGWSLFGQYPRFQGLLPYVAVIGLGLLLVDAFSGRALPIAWALAAAGGAVGGYTLVQTLGLDPIRDWGGSGDTVVYNGSTIGHTNFSGGFLAIVLPLSIFLWVEAPRGKRWAAALTALTAEGLVLANSQGGWAAGLAGAAVVIGFLLAPTWRRAPSFGLLLAGLVAVAAVGSVALSMVEPDLSLVGGTIESRGVYWQTAIDLAAESPLVGRGPNGYAVEGVRHRPLSDALLMRYGSADDPHSVLFSYLANAGLLGALGYLTALGWVLKRGVALARERPLAAAFLASAAAYFVQSLVSIDELSLTVGLWAALAGLVSAGSTRDRTRRDPQGVAGTGARRLRLGAALATMIAVSALAAAFVVGWLRADHEVLQGVRLFRAGHAAEAQERFESALGFRDEFYYRQVYAEGLGLAALDGGGEGEALIEKMRAVNAYLDDFPETTGILASARILHHWGHFAPDGDREALALFRRGLELDPQNPLIRIEISEVLIDLGRRPEAVEVLDPLVPDLRHAAPEFWGALAIARLSAADLPAARAAAATATRLGPHDCRVRIARELLRVAAEGAEEPPDPTDALNLGLGCDPALYRLFLDRLPPRARGVYEAPTLPAALADDAR